MTDRRENFVSIQYLRALAALLVVVLHIFSPAELADYTPKPWGQFGVDLFFVISGFIMWRTTRENRSPLSFWRARIFRIVPLYWIFTTVPLIFAIFKPSVLDSTSSDIVFILKSYLFIPSEHPLRPEIVPFYAIGWTLNYEMFFYLLFGLCLLVAKASMRFTIVIAILAALVLAGSALQSGNAILVTYTSPLLLEFGFGVAIAFAYERFRAPLWIGATEIVAGAAWLAAYYAAYDVLPHRFIVHALPAALIVDGVLRFEHLLRARPNKVALLLGDASYSLYLSHPFVARAWYRLFTRFDPISSTPSVAIFAITTLLVCCLGAIICYQLIEQPVIRLARRLTTHADVRAQPAA